MIVFDFDVPEHDLNAPNSRNPRQVPAEQTTVLRVLRTKDTEYGHVVRNVLIDHCMAERLLLVEVRPPSKSRCSSPSRRW